MAADRADAGLGAAADEHPLLAALRVQAELWPSPSVDIGPPHDGFAAISELVEDDRFLDRMLDHQQNSAPGLDRKGAAAFLVTEYSSLFSITAAAPFVGFGIVPDLSPSSYALAFGAGPDGGRRVAVRFLSSEFATDDPESAGSAQARLVDRGDLRDHLREIVERHFQRLIERLWGKTGLSRKALWRLVGDSVAARFLEAGYRFGRVDSAKGDALAILKRTGSPLNNRQLGYFDVVVRDEDDPERVVARRTFRARGGCCRYYKAEGGVLCTTCVLRDPADRDRNLENLIRRSLNDNSAVH